MALVHNFIIRILNCIYLQAPNVKLEEDIKDFAIFMYAWCILIHEHHSNEENLFFPWLEEYVGVPNYMEKNVEQHHAFAPGMEKFENYVKAVKEGKEGFDAEKVRSLIDNFGPILTQHLKEEIESLEELDKFGDKVDWVKWNKRVSDHAVKTAEKVRYRTLHLQELVTNLRSRNTKFQLLLRIWISHSRRQSTIQYGHPFHGLYRLCSGGYTSRSIRELGAFLVAIGTESRKSLSLFDVKKCLLLGVWCVVVDRSDVNGF